jgi:hypothetical protein
MARLFKRKIVIYKIRNPGQTAKNDVKHLEVKRKKMSLYGTWADGDNYLGLSFG